MIGNTIRAACYGFAGMEGLFRFHLSTSQKTRALYVIMHSRPDITRSWILVKPTTVPMDFAANCARLDYEAIAMRFRNFPDAIKKSRSPVLIWYLKALGKIIFHIFKGCEMVNMDIRKGLNIRLNTFLAENFPKQAEFRQCCVSAGRMTGKRSEMTVPCLPGCFSGKTVKENMTIGPPAQFYLWRR